MFKSLKITCDEATAICDKNQYGEASFLELFKLNIHFIRCKVCALYTKQNIKLTQLFKGHASSCKSLKRCISEEEKDKMKKALEEMN